MLWEHSRSIFPQKMNVCKRLNLASKNKSYCKYCISYNQFKYVAKAFKISDYLI